MSWVDFVCCNRHNYEEEEYLLPPPLTSNETHLPPIPYKDVLDDEKSTGELMFNMLSEHHPSNVILPFKLKSSYPPIPLSLHSAPSRPFTRYRIPLDDWCFYAPLQGKFSVLKDWAAALHERHANGVVHGNLTPDSVDVVDGKGILLNQGTSPDHGLSCRWIRPPQDDDLRSVRWTATEFFHIDDRNPHPTTMSDVYSFGCLMLQMLTGSVPYCSTKRPEQVVYLKYLGREPIDADTPKVADHYATFMRGCWSLEPEKRPTMETVVGFIHHEVQSLAGGRRAV